MSTDELAAALQAEIEKRTEGLTDEEYLATLDLLMEGIDNLALARMAEIKGCDEGDL